MFDRSVPRRGVVLGATLCSLAGLASAGGAEAGQSPALDARVEAGELPPVPERLPSEPFVETMVEGIGRYGGTLRTAILASGDHYNLTRTVANETLMRWTPDWNRVFPSIARDFSVSDDATTFTFQLREGMRWSDGAPFTADDILFWYEDVFLNEELTPVKNPIFVRNDEPVLVEKVDDHAVRFTFTEPYGLFLQILAYGDGHIPVIYPKHYLSQFHERYNEEGLPALIEADATAGDWVSLFNSKVSLSYQPPFWQNLDLPTLNPWVLTIPYADGDRVAVTRNPYYWKVDPDGNQLPYLDGITWSRLDSPELMALQATTGEFDFVFRHIVTPVFRSVLYDGQDGGNYRFLPSATTGGNSAVIMLNLTVDDPVKREVFRNRDFRVALSHAIDRQEIIDLIYLGEGTPVQVAPGPGHELHIERMATQYTEHDPERANELLDGIMPERDVQGFRLGPDGQRFTINFLISDTGGQAYPDVMQMVQGYARDVGIDIQLRTTDRARLNTMWQANEHEAYMWNCGGGASDAYTAPRCYMPYQRADINFAPLWADWYADPNHGEEPPESVRAIYASYSEVGRATDDEVRLEDMRRFMELSADEFFVIGLRRAEPGQSIVSRDLRNVYPVMHSAGTLFHPAPQLTQWWFDR